MKKIKIFGVLCIGCALSMGLLSCEKSDGNETPKVEKVTGNQIVWNGDNDKAVAVNIGFVESQRENASGPKITSNAHSADFPGIYFIWDSKQKDNGYLKVSAQVFSNYKNFTLTSKESNMYFDFVISIKPGQILTIDNCYVFFIPKVYNNKNINMVFISDYVLAVVDSDNGGEDIPQ